MVEFIPSEAEPSEAESRDPRRRKVAGIETMTYATVGSVSHMVEFPGFAASKQRRTRAPVSVAGKHNTVLSRASERK